MLIFGFTAILGEIPILKKNDAINIVAAKLNPGRNINFLIITSFLMLNKFGEKSHFL